MNYVDTIFSHTSFIVCIDNFLYDYNNDDDDNMVLRKEIRAIVSHNRR